MPSHLQDRFYHYGVTGAVNNQQPWYTSSTAQDDVHDDQASDSLDGSSKSRLSKRKFNRISGDNLTPLGEGQLVHHRREWDPLRSFVHPYPWFKNVSNLAHRTRIFLLESTENYEVVLADDNNVKAVRQQILLLTGEKLDIKESEFRDLWLQLEGKMIHNKMLTAEALELRQMCNDEEAFWALRKCSSCGEVADIVEGLAIMECPCGKTLFNRGPRMYPFHGLQYQ